jgi:hypothetical protein
MVTERPTASPMKCGWMRAFADEAYWGRSVARRDTETRSTPASTRTTAYPISSRTVVDNHPGTPMRRSR